MFQFKQFFIDDARCAMKVGTDGVLLGAWATVAGARRILDVGCGSGLIALMAAQRAGEAQVAGVEIDGGAAADARCNVAASPFADRVEVVEADVLQFTQNYAGARFDCILSNPPYHQETLLPPSSSRAKARHTEGGGLRFEALLETADRLIDKDCPTARLALILPSPALPRFLPLAELHGWHLCRRTDVVTRKGKPAKRVLLEWQLQAAGLVHDELELVGDDGGRSAQYAALCEAFYL